ncbi:Putative pectinesterase/pectinesterase inhibitor 28 [Linum perenne]
MVVAVTIGIEQGPVEEASGDGGHDLSSSKKSISSICLPAQFRASCEESLQKSGGNLSDPNDLVKISFKLAQKSIGEAMLKSDTLIQPNDHPMTHQAIETCKELMNMSIAELQDCMDKVQEQLDFAQLDDYMDDLSTWLSAAMTYQQTCLDGFVNVSTDVGDKMHKLMNVSMQLTTNGLDIVTGLNTLLNSFNPEIAGGSHRHLLTAEDGSVVNLPVLGHGDTPYPTWVPDRFRRLLENSGDTSKNDSHKEDSHNKTETEKKTDVKEGPLDETETEEKKDNAAKEKKDFSKPAAEIADITVAADGSGDYETVKEALDKILEKKKKVGEVVVVYIKEGIYEEYVEVKKKIDNLVLIGDGADRTLITGDKSFVDGVGTFKTPTVAVVGNYFFAKNLRIENSAGPEKHQAVALRVSADFAVFYNCTFDGYEDTLYTHTKRQFYRDCTISGTVDYITGDAAAVFQNCLFLIRKPLDNQSCVVTAQGRKQRHQPSAIIIQNGTITASSELKSDPNKAKVKSYLGQPVKNFSRTIIMESYIDDVIDPEGWVTWMGTAGTKTCWYGEYGNYGPGANTSRRVTWKGIKNMTLARAVDFSPERFIRSDPWVKATGIPYVSYMVRPSTSRRVDTELTE